MHRLTRLLILATFAVVWLACGIARADYVTVTQGGYGPFTCARDGGGPLPSWGCVELIQNSWYGPGECQRYRGDVVTPGHVGRAVSLPGDPFFSLVLSPSFTTHYGCYSIVPGNSPVPCDSYVTDTSNDPYTGDWRNGSVLGYLPPCPTTGGAAFTQLYMCTGAYTPYDGSGLLTAVISDGHAAPGLPRGNPLKLQPTVGNDVSCVATMSNYPNVSNGGHPVLMAVYTCP